MFLAFIQVKLLRSIGRDFHTPVGTDTSSMLRIYIIISEIPKNQASTTTTTLFPVEELQLIKSDHIKHKLELERFVISAHILVVHQRLPKLLHSVSVHPQDVVAQL